MVNNLKVKSKKAIAMIELIFALVIMGIVLMSAPMLIHQSIQSGNVALQQEAISLTAEKVSWILSLPWDENSSDIIIINNTPKGLLDNSGNILSNLRSFEENSTASAVSSFGTVDAFDTTFDDVDDWHGNRDGLILFNTETTTTSVGDYVDNNVSIATTINYAEDSMHIPSNKNIIVTKDINSSSTLTSSNIKFISVTLTANRDIEELNKTITLQAFSCNIGSYFINGKEIH